MVDDVDWEKSRSIHQSNLAILPAEASSSKSGGFGKQMNFPRNSFAERLTLPEIEPMSSSL
jgi:hypothetical protein